MQEELPQLTPYFGSGSLVESTSEHGPAGADRHSDPGIESAGRTTNSRSIWRGRFGKIRGVADVFIPQDLDQPALKLDIDRVRARELGLSQKEVVPNVITALTSNQMIAPSLWIDPRNGNPYYLAVQYPEKQVQNHDRPALDSAARACFDANRPVSTWSAASSGSKAPTEVDHYQIRRAIDVFVRPLGEDLSVIARQIDRLIANATSQKGWRSRFEEWWRACANPFRASASDSCCPCCCST